MDTKLTNNQKKLNVQCQIYHICTHKSDQQVFCYVSLLVTIILGLDIMLIMLFLWFVFAVQPILSLYRHEVCGDTNIIGVYYAHERNVFKFLKVETFFAYA